MRGAYCYHKGKFIPVMRHIDYYIDLNPDLTLEQKNALRLEGIDRDKLISSYKDIARVRCMLDLTLVQCDNDIAWEVIPKFEGKLRVIDFNLNVIYERN